MPTVQPGPSPVLTPTANRVGCEREVATSVLAANHNRGWSVPGTREQSEIPRATGVEYGARSCQGSMYQAESLIAPKALLAKLLLWNVTLPRYPMVRRKPRFLPLYLLSRPFEHPRISFPLWLYVIDFLFSFFLFFFFSLQIGIIFMLKCTYTIANCPDPLRCWRKILSAFHFEDTKFDFVWLICVCILELRILYICISFSSRICWCVDQHDNILVMRYRNF